MCHLVCCPCWASARHVSRIDSPHALHNAAMKLLSIIRRCTVCSVPFVLYTLNTRSSLRCAWALRWAATCVLITLGGAVAGALFQALGRTGAPLASALLLRCAAICAGAADKSGAEDDDAVLEDADDGKSQQVSNQCIALLNAFLHVHAQDPGPAGDT